MDSDDLDSLSAAEQKSYRKLAHKNFGQFALQVQHMSAEVQLKIIAQLPEFRQLASRAIDGISAAHKATIDSDARGEDHVHQGAREWRLALIELLDGPELSLDEKLRITAEIARTVELQQRLHSEATKARMALFGKVVFGTVAVAGMVVVAVSGGKIGLSDNET